VTEPSSRAHRAHWNLVFMLHLLKLTSVYNHRSYVPGSPYKRKKEKKEKRKKGKKKKRKKEKKEKRKKGKKKKPDALGD
jgi:hypothetical protein